MIVFDFRIIVFQFSIIVKYWNQRDAANVAEIVQHFKILCVLCMSWFVRHESLTWIDGTISTAGFTMAHVWTTSLLLTIIDSFIFLVNKTRKFAVTRIHVPWKLISNWICQSRFQCLIMVTTHLDFGQKRNRKRKYHVLPLYAQTQ